MTVGQDTLQRVWDEIAFGATCFALPKELTLATCEHVYKNTNIGKTDLVWSVALSFGYLLAKEHSLFSLSSRYQPKKIYELSK